MAGGGQNQQNSAAQIMQGVGSSMMPQNPNTQNQGLAQLQQAIQKLGGPKPNAAMQFGQGLAGMAQAPQPIRPQMPMPMQRLGGMAPAPMQGAVPPQMATGGMGMPQGGMNIQQLNAMLGQRNGLMG